MKVVLRVAFGYVKKNIKRTLLTFFGVALAFMLTSMTCWLCGELIENSSGESNGFTDSMSFSLMLLVMMFEMCFFIINGTFGITFSGRIKLMGLLTSLGADGKQKTAVLFAETLLYAVFGGALGTAGGILAVRGLYFALAEKYELTEMLGSRFFVNRGLIALGAVIGVLSVFAAAVKPVRRLAKISTVEAMKGQEQINVSLKQGFFAGVAEKLFGFYGKLAGEIYDNHKSKYRTISLALSGGTIFYITSFCLTVYYPLKKYPNTFDYAPTRNITTAFMALVALFVALFLLSSLGSASINFERRKSEFAMFKSLGMTTGGLCKLVLIESAFLAYYAAFYGLVGSLIGDFVALVIHGSPSSHNPAPFGFPILLYLFFLALDIVICVLFSLYNVLRLQRLNIVKEIRRE